jgi:HipA-like protein
MRSLQVYRNNILAARLTEMAQNHYILRYEDQYFNDPRNPPISLTLPKTSQEFHAKALFPFFFNLLSEGVNRNLQVRMLGLEETDHFGLLLMTAQEDTIGPVTVKPTQP